MEFQEMNLIPPLAKAVKDNGYTVPTPIQKITIPLILEKKDILGCAQTGTGKTAAFALPILQRLTENDTMRRTGARPIRSLILAPTRELAVQNHEAFLRFGKHLTLRTTAVFGGVAQARQVQALKRGVDILVATPGRLIDLIHQGLISLSELEIFVLDEADRMLDMGFIHDVKTVISLLPEKRQTLLFSATMPPEVEGLALTLLRDPETVKVDPVTSTVDRISQSVYFINKENKNDLLLSLLNDKTVSAALVFTRRKCDADQVVRVLQRRNIAAMAIHGNKSQNARQEALNSFKSGRIKVLVATDIAARGIDITELPFVINYSIPEEAETYIHRIGRTGRAGLGGTAISMCCSEELSDWRAIERLTKSSIPTDQCQWSVADMKPTKRAARGQRPNDFGGLATRGTTDEPFTAPRKPGASRSSSDRAKPSTKNNRNERSTKNGGYGNRHGYGKNSGKRLSGRKSSQRMRPARSEA